MTEKEITSHYKIAAEKILEFLHERLGFQLWAVTRTYNDHWIMLVTKDNGYHVKDGDVFVWSDSFCSRMVQSKGPQIAPRVKDIPEYVSAPIGTEFPIASYIGMPLKKDDGSLFGTLCAIDPVEHPDSLLDELPLIKLFSELLEQLLQADMKTAELLDRLENAQLTMGKDPVTQLNNQATWDLLMIKEQKRCDELGSSALIIILNIDNGVSLSKVAQYLKDIFRSTDIEAYMGNNCFAVLAIEIDNLFNEEFISRIIQSFIAENITGKIGWAEHDPRNTLKETQVIAEKNMMPIT
jgi:diguanylate cyclase